MQIWVSRQIRRQDSEKVLIGGSGGSVFPVESSWLPPKQETHSDTLKTLIQRARHNIHRLWSKKGQDSPMY